MTTRPGRRPGFLDIIERIGNALPNPTTLFLILAGVVVVASWLASRLGVAVPHPLDGSRIEAVNLLNAEGIRRMFTEAVRNFTGFAPLGTVLVAMLGIGVAEATGLIAAAMRVFVLGMPRKLLTLSVVFMGINAHLAADAGIILLPPIAAMLYAASGRHPLAGIAAAFAGVAGTFSASFLPTTLDVLLAGFTQASVDASRLFPGYQVQLLGNWYFMAASSPILILVGAWITDRIIEPRLGPWKPAGSETTELDSTEHLGAGEKRGLAVAGWAFLATIALMLLLTIPPGAPLRVPGDSLIVQLKPFFDSMVVWVVLVFLIPGLAYGIAVGSVRNDHDVARMTGETMAGMGTYIVLAFTCAQFVNYFAWSNLAAIIAISGAKVLGGVGLEGGPLLVGFVFLAALLNLIMSSSSALWAVLGPVFVPMFGLLGFSPEATQAIYRIGESATNIVTPLMPYLPFVLTVASRYDPKAGPGTLISLMIPYAITFLIFWTALLLVFYGLDWPIGPGVGIRLAH